MLGDVRAHTELCGKWESSDHYRPKELSNSPLASLVPGVFLFCSEYFSISSDPPKEYLTMTPLYVSVGARPSTARYDIASCRIFATPERRPASRIRSFERLS